MATISFVFFLTFAFLVGAALGSFLNVCVARLPYEKSVLWPSSRCGTCFQPIQGRDNVPLLSYWLLRGRCRACGTTFSVRYFVVELVTGLAFAGLLYALVFLNVRELRFIDHFWGVKYGLPPIKSLPLLIHHATLFCFLLVTALCDLDDMEIPLPLTVTGTLVGLAFATLLPWPYPETLPPRVPPRFAGVPEFPPCSGVYPWPVWYPLPDWLPAGSWQLGLATGLAGALAGMAVLRGVRFLFGLGRGLEGMGVGDADLMMMAGAFIGWQPVVLAFFVSVFPALLFGVVQLVRKGDHPMPFGPGLAAGVLLTLLAWPVIGRQARFAFFEPVMLGVLTGAGAIILLVTAFLLRLVRGIGK
jgi:leader peptidase (prepilin peptidase)/N-methyltransferase